MTESVGRLPFNTVIAGPDHTTALSEAKPHPTVIAGLDPAIHDEAQRLMSL